MGKTNLLSRELVRCASQMLLPCSDASCTGLTSELPSATNPR